MRNRKTMWFFVYFSIIFKIFSTWSFQLWVKGMVNLWRDIRLREINQSQKDKCYVMPLSRGPYRDREQSGGCQGLGDGAPGYWGFTGRRASAWEDEEVLEMDGGDRCTALSLYLMPPNVHLKMVKGVDFVFSSILLQWKRNLWKGKLSGNKYSHSQNLSRRFAFCGKTQVGSITCCGFLACFIYPVTRQSHRTGVLREAHASSCVIRVDGWHLEARERNWVYLSQVWSGIPQYGNTNGTVGLRSLAW